MHASFPLALHSTTAQTSSSLKEKLLRCIHSQMDFSLLNADEFSVVRLGMDLPREKKRFSLKIRVGLAKRQRHRFNPILGVQL